MTFNQPILFSSNRVWRAYIGGALMDTFLSGHSSKDGHFPEDWLASTTRANNYANQQYPEEGLVRIKAPNGSEDGFFKDLLAEYPHEMVGNDSGELGVLCKYLDSAIRLPLQCHPDQAFAKQYFDSPNGKTESWFVLATRTIDGEDPYLLMGFRDEAKEDEFKQAVLEQDIPTMVNAMHKIPVKPGDMYFIPGRLPHAIGPGVFLLEVQEPTDWVIQPEQYLGDTELSHQEMWGPLRIEDGLNCFDYDSKGSIQQIMERCRLKANAFLQDKSYSFSEIIGPSITDCFSVYKLDVCKGVHLTLNTWAIAVVTEGRATINDISLKTGDYFFIPHAAEELAFGDGSKAGIYLISQRPLTLG